MIGAHAIAHGDVLTTLRELPDDEFDALLSDPPYFLEFMGKEWDKAEVDLPVGEVAFRSWLAGLIAGEGYFRIQEHDARYSCAFGIHMRADEAPLLRALQKRTGLGRIKEEPATTDTLVKSAPSARWEWIVERAVRDSRGCSTVIRSTARSNANTPCGEWRSMRGGGSREAIAGPGPRTRARWPRASRR